MDSINPETINEVLTRTLLRAKKDLKELARLKKKELGPKSALYTQTFLDDVKQVIQEVGDEDKNESEERISFIKKRGHSGDLSNIQFSDNQAINQLTEQLVEKENELKRKTLTALNLKEIFARSRNLIEHLWTEMHIPPNEAAEFAKKYFYPETIMNYVIMFQEIAKLSKVRGIQHQVLTLIEQREAYILRLRQISQQLLTNKRSSNSFYETTLISNEVPDIIQNLREITTQIILAIMRWRDKLTRRQPFTYNSQNYIIKMRNDLDFLKMTPLGPHMEKTFPLESNPLLLPMIHINERFTSSLSVSTGNQQNKFSKPLMNTSAKSLKQSVNTSIVVNSSIVLFEPNHSKNIIPNNSNIIQTKNSQLLKSLEDRGEKFIEDCIRVDRVIFVGEDKFLNEMMELEIKEQAATKIQCFVRLYMAKKIARQLRREKNIRYRKIQEVVQPISARQTVSDDQLQDEEEDAMMTRLESRSNGDMVGCEGRFNRKIFNRREDHVQLA